MSIIVYWSGVVVTWRSWNSVFFLLSDGVIREFVFFSLGTFVIDTHLAIFGSITCVCYIH